MVEETRKKIVLRFSVKKISKKKKRLRDNSLGIFFVEGDQTICDTHFSNSNRKRGIET